MADGSSGLPSSNRGVIGFSEGTGISVGIDWLSASVDLLAVLAEQGAVRHGPASMNGALLDALNDEGSNVAEVAAHVFAFFFAGTGLELSEEAKGAGRFYRWRVPIKDSAGAFVGQIELGSYWSVAKDGTQSRSTYRKDGTATARIELTGAGCRIYSEAGDGHGVSRWLSLRAKLESVAGRLTRVDVAADDLLGLHPISLAKTWLEAGEFDYRGHKAKRQLIDDFDSGDGKTLNIGSRSSEKYLRVYEKGRELGDPSSPWVRYEGEFKASARKELPLDMLRDPAGYLLGAYPVLKFIDAMARRIDVTDAANTATWKSCRRHLKRQYGATLRFIVANTQDDAALAGVIKSLTSNKLPAWGSKEAAKNWPEILLAATTTEREAIA